MTKTIRLFFTSAMLMAALASLQILSACGSKSDGPGQPQVAPTGPAVVNAGPGSGIQQCQIGNIYSAQYGCMDRYSCQPGFGWVVGQNFCAPGQVVTALEKYGTGFGAQFMISLQISNGVQFDKLLQALGLCDQYWFNYGNAKCSIYSQAGGFIYIQALAATSSTVSVTVGAGTSNPTQAVYTYGNLWTSNSYLVKSLSAQVYPTNNSQGIQIVTSGGYNGDFGFRLIANTDTLSSNSMNVIARYGNADFATGQGVRY
jgi:hypothetical protein